MFSLAQENTMLAKFTLYSCSLILILSISACVGSTSTQQTENSQHIPLSDDVPIANAGINQNVLTGNMVTLNGSNSSDDNVSSSDLIYTWTLIPPVGSSAILSSTSSSRTTLVPDVDGVYTINLVVSDGVLTSISDTVIVTASSTTPTNAAPVADAGVNQSVSTGSLVTLDGTNSSDDVLSSSSLTYSWELISRPENSNATLSSTSSSQPTFTVDVDGSYVIDLIVNDGALNSASDSVVITSSTINSSPELLNLQITEPSGNAQPKAKVRSGVPFPKGRLLSSDKVELFSSDGLPLPTQVKTLSKWNDGSIRWLLVDTALALAENETKNLLLKKVDNVTPIANRINIQESSEFVTVDTGALKVEIPKLYGGIIHRAWVSDQLVIDEPTSPAVDRGAFISVFDTSDNSTVDYFGGLLQSNSTPLTIDPIKFYMDRVNSSSNANFNLYNPWNLEVVIEDNAPLHSVIRISGTHLNTEGMGFSTFIVRLHFYKDESFIKVSHTMVYTGDETQQIKSFGLKLPMISSGSSTIIEGTRPASGLGEVRHLSYRDYQVNGSSISGQALGYVGRSNNNVNMSIILRDMAEHFPKALAATNAGLEVQLYPDSTSPWDLTKYTPPANQTESSSFPGNEIATRAGETTSFSNHLFLRGAQGLSTSDDYLISFATGALNTTAIESTARAIDSGPLMLVASAQWYSDAKVMGVGSFAFEHDVNTSEGHYRIDKFLQVVRDFMRIAQRKEFDWFGIEDYGDIRGEFLGGNGEGFVFTERGRYGFSGNSGEPSNQLWVQYLRKPTQQTFLDAEALARHTLDQQTVHFATSMGESGTELDGRNMFSSVGSLHRHGVQAWSGYAGNPDYSHVGGIETYYYLTGDQRAKEVLYEQAQFITRQNLVRTALKNGLDVVDRAAAVFYDEPLIETEFTNKATIFLDYMASDADGNGYNAVQERLIDSDGNGVHDRVQGIRTNKNLYQSAFEYFVRGAPGLLYYHERNRDNKSAALVFDAANILTYGDPKNPAGTGDDWNLGVNGDAGSVFYHINTLSYAAEIANQYDQDRTPYFQLAKRCIENNTHAGSDFADTSPITLQTVNKIPDDWNDWRWLWQEEDDFSSINPGILWIHRQIMYRNMYMQDYHSYRPFIHLSTGAALVGQGQMILR